MRHLALSARRRARWTAWQGRAPPGDIGAGDRGPTTYRARRTRQPTILTDDQDNDAPLAVVVPAAQYEEYLRLRDAEDERRVREAVADDRPGRTFASVAELRAAAGLSPSTGAA